MVNPLAKLATAPIMLVVPTMSATAMPVAGAASGPLRASMRMKIKTRTPTMEEAAVTMLSHFCFTDGTIQRSTRSGINLETSP